MYVARELVPHNIIDCLLPIFVTSFLLWGLGGRREADSQFPFDFPFSFPFDSPFLVLHVPI